MSKTKSVSMERIAYKGRQYTIEYVSKEDIYPTFGYAEQTTAFVRNDLLPRVQKFVKAHELFHLQDTTNKRGWLIKEVRTNMIVGLHDPLGLLATTIACLNKDRLKFYVRRFKEKL